MGKGWTPERRARQAALIHKWRPWEKSTGPRTAKGKAHTARNGDKGGAWKVERDRLRALRTEVNDLLRLGGHAFIQVPSYGLYRQVPDWAAHLENFCAVHYWYFTAETLTRLAQVSGLEPVFVHDDVPHRHLTVIARKSREALARTPSAR